MNMNYSAADAEFQQAVQAFLAQQLTPELKLAAARTTTVFCEKDIALSWQQKLHKQGWVGPLWPKEYGGPGFTPVQRYIFQSECAKAGAPGLIPLGLRMVGPVIMKFGTPTQKAFYLPRILSGEDYWCQGYSEPGAGSDLANLQCRAEREGEYYRVNGTKIWTTHAHFANRIFCLVRTQKSDKPQRGISFLLIDMDSPGIRVDPIVTIAGDHELNQVFFDDVMVPVSNLIGEENQGWTCAKYLLEFERGGDIVAAQLQNEITHLRAIAEDTDFCTQPLIQDPLFLRRLTELEIEALALEYTELRVMSTLSAGGNPGSDSSMLKIIATELEQKISELTVEALGWYALPNQPARPLYQTDLPNIGPYYAAPVVPSYLNKRAATIYGGSNEVQRNIIAKAVLNL